MSEVGYFPVAVVPCWGVGVKVARRKGGSKMTDGRVGSVVVRKEMVCPKGGRDLDELGSEVMFKGVIGFGGFRRQTEGTESVKTYLTLID